MNENQNRISWQETFIEIAKIVAKRSPDARTQVGGLLVKNNRILAIGYNGTISNFQLDFNWANEEKYTYVVHCEENCLMNAAKIGANVEGSDLYITLSPCNHCIKLIAQAGIKKVYYLEEYKDFELTKKIADNADIELIKIEK